MTREELLAAFREPIAVLDDGHVLLVDVMGDEQAIVDAARVSYGAGTKRVQEDAGLLRYLMRHQHTTPLEMAEIKLRVRVPMDCWRQWIRHRTASVNEYSTRYSEAIDSRQKTAPDAWRAQASGNKQGSAGVVTEWPPMYLKDAEQGDATAGEWLTDREASLHNLADEVYRERLAFGVAREQARKDLPLSTYCYDEGTDVLTHRGFVAWPDVRPDDKIGAWDPSRGLCYELPEYLTKDRYSGDMYRVRHRGVSLLVTPHHKMWVSVAGDQFALVSAETLGHRTSVRYCKTAPLHEGVRYNAKGWGVKDPKALLRLFGFFIGDGSAPRSGDKSGVVFSLRRQRKIDYIRQLAAAIGWPCDVRGPHLVIRYPDITRRFRDMFYDANGHKQIPHDLLDLGWEDAAAILDGLKNSDGHVTGADAWRFDSTSEQVAEAAMILGVHAGYAVNRGQSTLRDPPSSDVHHVLFLSSKSATPVVNQMRRNTFVEQYDGYVYCAKTRTGIMVVRRDGKVVLSGNTEAYWKIDLHNLLHFLSLRLDAHAQQEIRAYATAIASIVKAWVPTVWDAFQDYRLNAVTFSGREWAALKQTMAGALVTPLDVQGMLDRIGITNKRERQEFLAKMEGL